METLFVEQFGDDDQPIINSAQFGNRSWQRYIIGYEKTGARTCPDPGSALRQRRSTHTQVAALATNPGPRHQPFNPELHLTHWVKPRWGLANFAS
jgi:hypothetical protein